MSFHTHFDKWIQRTVPENCPVCLQAPMPEDMEDIVELPHSWLSAEPLEPLKGTCHLIAKQHAIELFDFSPDVLLELMVEIQLCARALKTVTKAVKINYEIHGNTIPHFHVHLYPRYLDDPFPGQAINYNRKRKWFPGDQYQQFIQDMRREISALHEEYSKNH